MAADVSCFYSSCACNKSPHTLDWGCNNLICYAACNSIQLLTFEKHVGGKHRQTLVGHKQLVTSVHWISKADGSPENELISTSADQTAAIWTLKGFEFFMSQPLIGHKNVVKTATSLYLEGKDDQHLVVATSSADSSIKIWERCTGLVECKQSIMLGNGFALDLKLSYLKDQQDPILIIGADDAKIHLYIQDEKGLFNHTIHLDGHEDWIQSLDVMHEENGCLMLTSASQDNYIRIWKISPKCAETQIHSKDLDLKVEETLFTTHKGYSYSVSLEAVLSGHENWIYSVKWRPNQNLKCKSQEILSASMDKTMIIWEADSNSNLWIEKVRVGEVGGNTLGFYGGVFSNSIPHQIPNRPNQLPMNQQQMMVNNQQQMMSSNYISLKSNNLENSNHQQDIPPPLPTSPPPIEPSYQTVYSQKPPSMRNQRLNDGNYQSHQNSVQSMTNDKIMEPPAPPARKSSYEVTNQMSSLGGNNRYATSSMRNCDNNMPHCPKKVSFHDSQMENDINCDTNGNHESGGSQSYTLDDINEVLATPQNSDNLNTYNPGNTPGVIGSQEVYRDPRQRIAAERTQQDRGVPKNPGPEKLTFKEKMKMFAQEVGEPETPKDKVKISRAQRDIETNLNGS